MMYAERGLRAPRIVWYSQAASDSTRLGNVLDVFPCARERTAVLLADVSHDGLRTERYARSLHRVVRASADANAPARVLDLANSAFGRTINEYGGNRSFATVFVGTLRGRVMTYASAGYDLGLIVNAAGQHRHLPNTGALFGVDGDRYADESVVFESGDWLILASGGVAYTRDRDGEPFGTHGIARSAIAALVANLADPAPAVLEASRRHAAAGRLSDDASVLCVELT